MQSTPSAGESYTSVAVPSDSAPACRRKIPSRLKLSPPLNTQDESDSHGKMMTHNPFSLELDRDSRQQESGHRVKMGNRCSCPRTPLGSAGSSSGLTPTVPGWRHIETEAESSTCSPSILDFVNTDFGHSLDEINSILSLSYPRSLNSDRIGLLESFSTPTTLSPESCPSEAGSMYSNDPYEAGKSKAIEALPTSEESILVPSPIIVSPSSSYSAFSTYPSEDLNLQATPQSRGPSLRSISASQLLRSNRSRTASVAVTPSLVTEHSKTIQARRSFGQLLLFRRPSQVREGACICARSCALHAPDEEKEELQSNVSVASTNYLGDLHEDKLDRYNPIDNINTPSQLAKDGSQPLSNTLRRSLLTPTSPQPCETFSNPPPDQATGSSTISHSPKGLLKLVKSQSSLREIFFWPKHTERRQSVQFDHLANNKLTSFSEAPGSTMKAVSPLTNQPSPNGIRSSIESGWRTSFSTFQSVNPVQTDPKCEFPLKAKDSQSGRSTQRGSINQSVPMNIFKFWKKKNFDNPNPNAKVVEPIQKNTEKKGLKKRGRPSVRIDQISSPILCPSNQPDSKTLSLNTRPLLLSPKLMDNDPELSYFKPSSANPIIPCCVTAPEATISPPFSPSVCDDLTAFSLIEPTQIQKIIQAGNLHLPQPTRPPRRRPVMLPTF